jgi:hypothetical protein
MKAIWNIRFAFTLTILVFSVPAAFPGDEGRAPFPDCSVEKQRSEGREGVVMRYLINPFGEIDGLFLDDGLLASLPPHMSADIADLVKPGDAVALSGKPEGQSRFEACSVTHVASDRTVVRGKPAWNGKVMPKELRIAALEELSVSGKIGRVVTGKRGEPKIIVLENGTNVRLPGKISSAGSFSTSSGTLDARLLHAGAPFAASGPGTETRYGNSLEASAIGPGPGSLKPLVPSLRPSR